MLHRARLIYCLFLASVLLAPRTPVSLLHAQQSKGPHAAPRIAITIDDLPWHGPVPEEGIAAAGERLLAPLVERGIVATGFVNCGRLSDHRGGLRPWLTNGMELGNHTAHHRDLNSAQLDRWLEDVRSCDRALREVTGAPVRHFRYPMLHQGATVKRRDAALRLLGELGYEIAHVTVDNSDYLLARPYAAALRAGDEAERRRLGALFVEHVVAATRHARQVARRKLGREVDHVLLLHANSVVAHHLGELLDALEAAGFTFVSLGEALRDPVYDLPDAYLGRKGLSWLYRIEPLSDADVAWDDAQAARLRRQLEGN